MSKGQGATKGRFVAAAASAAVSLAGCGGAPPPKQPDLAADPPASATSDPGAESSFQAELSRASNLIKEERYAEARPLLETLQGQQPKSPEVAFYLAMALEKTGDRRGAEAQYKKALEIDPQFTEAALNLGAFYLDDPPRPDEAIRVLKRALEHSPSAGLHLNLAYAHSLKGDVNAAVEQFEAALKLGEDVGLRLAYGEFLIKTAKRPAQAATQLKTALKDAGDDAALLASIGRWLGQVREYKDCIAAFDRAIAIKKDEAEFYVRRGLCRHGLRDEAGAKADFTSATHADPKLVAAHYYLGEALLAERKPKEALVEFEKAAELGAETELGKRARERAQGIKR